MKIQDLEKKYFGDVKTNKSVTDLINEAGIAFDCWSEPDEFGVREMLLTTEKEGEFILLEDAIVMDEDEFKKAYPTDTALLCYRNLRKQYIILNNEETREYYKKALKEAKKRLQLAATSIDDKELTCGGF